MASGRRVKSYLHVLAIFLALAGALVAPACGGGGGNGNGDPDPDPNPNPTPDPTVVQVHHFTFDTDTNLYTVVSTVDGTETTATQDDVDRDLVGSLCQKCHPSQVDQVKASVHFRLAAETDRIMFPGGGAHGMLDRACGLPSTTGLTNSISNIGLGECAKCHVGRYLPVMEGFFANMFGAMGVSDPAGQATQLINAGIDCLICHSEEYKSHPTDGILADIAGTATPDAHSPTLVGVARDSRDNADFNRDGVPDLVIDMDGDGVLDAPLMMDLDGNGEPETPWPTVAQDRSRDALVSIGHSNEHTCLRCHEHARTGYKRGTLFIEGHDLHAGLNTGVFANADNQCTVCHTADSHKFVRGHLVGGDLGAADYPPPPPGVAPDPNDPTDLTCQTCHDETELSSGIHTPRHLETISCEACHIPWGSGITYSLFGHGGHVSFARTEEGRDTRLVAADMYVAGDRADLDNDFEAFKTRPIFTWFNGGTSFLAQTLSARGSENAKITPFKPMANGMVFDARYFDGVMTTNQAEFGGVPYEYNAHSMYRFFANGSNAEAFAGLGMLSMTPDAVREVTLLDFQSPDPDRQTMALMQIFPNLVYFDKGNFGYEHFLTKTGSPFDANGDGIIDAGQDFLFDMYAAANAGLQQFMGFNGPMGFPADYSWYPPYTDVRQPISMKLPDGSLMKMFMKMQIAALPPENQAAALAAIEDYPAFSQVTLGGHGVLPKEDALGFGSACMDCHGPDGVMGHKVPVTQKVPVDMGPGMGVQDFPVYRWRYFQLHELIDLGLATSSEDAASGAVNLDIYNRPDRATFMREATMSFVLNWFAPSDPTGYQPADTPALLITAGLTADDLTWNGGKWMPVLEPVTNLKSNLEVLGYPAAGIPMVAPTKKAAK